MQASRALLALVIVMGVLIVLGTTGLALVVVHRLAHPSTVAAGTMAPVPGQELPVRQELGEPPGTRIVGVARQSDGVLAITLAGGGPDRVLIWDDLHATRLTELVLAPAPR